MNFRHRFAYVVVTLGLSLPAWAQTPPTDAGRVLQEAQQPLHPSAPAQALPPIKAPSQPAPPQSYPGDARVLVTSFSFAGNTVFSTQELRTRLADVTQMRLTFGELMQVVERIEAIYHDAGYFLAQAYLPPQQIRDGNIEIAITEGRLGATRIEGESRIDPEIIHGYLEHLPKGEPLRLPGLERQILLVGELAGAVSNLDLQAGDDAGTSDVVLVLKPDARLMSRVDVNNHGMAATGVHRVALNVIANSPAALGDRLSANAMMSDTRNLASYNLRYELPVGAEGWRLTGALTRAEYTLGGDFAALEGSGVADSVRIGAGYPLIRSRNQNLRAQIEADKSVMVDRISGTSTTKHGHGVTVSLAGDWIDGFLGTGMNRVDAALKHGQIFVADPSQAGWYDKLNLTLARQQILSPEWSVGIQWQEQFAAKNLDSSEKLSVGGPATLPGYANGEASADAGSLIKLSLRWQATPEIGLGLFSDYAHLRLAHRPATAEPNYRHLQDNGFSLDWVIDRAVSLNVLLAWPGRQASVGTDRKQPRLWASVGYAF